MAHNIDMTNGRANMAFLGERANIWHRLGAQMKPGMTIEQWLIEAGLNWQAIKVPLWANVSSLGLKDNQGLALKGIKLPEIAIVRSDNAGPLGVATETYQPHQAAQLVESFRKRIAEDDRFQLDTMGSLKGGRIIWMQATFNGDMDIVGEKHKARLLSTTTFDGTGATIDKATMTRVVCNNTLDAATADGGKAVVRTRHNTKYNPAKVSADLARIASGFDAYKSMAEAMVAVDMSVSDTSSFFKAILDIPFDADQSDISGRKLNQFTALNQAYQATIREGTEPKTAWTALNAVTRYVDHDRSTRGGDSADEARVLSSQFGSGAALKAKAVQLLYKPANLDASLDATMGGINGVLDAMGV